jgi:hypothetical protein
MMNEQRRLYSLCEVGCIAPRRRYTSAAGC